MGWVSVQRRGVKAEGLGGARQAKGRTVRGGGEGAQQPPPALSVSFTLADVSPSISEVLLSLPAAVTNWDVATAAVPGAPWVNGTAPCGGNGTTGGGGTAWKGLTCDTTPAPTRLELPGLGLQGTLPGELATLPYLQVR